VQDNFWAGGMVTFVILPLATATDFDLYAAAFAVRYRIHFGANLQLALPARKNTHTWWHDNFGSYCSIPLDGPGQHVSSPGPFSTEWLP